MHFWGNDAVLSHESFQFPSLFVGVIATAAARCIRTSSTRLFMWLTLASFSLSVEGPGRLPTWDNPCVILVVLSSCCPCHFGRALFFCYPCRFGFALFAFYDCGAFIFCSCCLSLSCFSCSWIPFYVILHVCYFLCFSFILSCYFVLEVSCGAAHVLYSFMFLMLFLFFFFFLSYSCYPWHRKFCASDTVSLARNGMSIS